MHHPEQDIKQRSPIWNVMQDLYMDTEVTSSYQYIARVCAQSNYTLIELEEILFNEVLPAVRFNMFALPAPEWTGFEISWLVARILKKHRFGKRKPIILRRYTAEHWCEISPLIIEYRISGKKD
jgi:hypothetical protein